MVFSLLHKEDVEKEEAAAAAKSDPAEENKTLRGDRHEGEKSFQPEADDLD